MLGTNKQKGFFVVILFNKIILQNYVQYIIGFYIIYRNIIKIYVDCAGKC